MGKKEISKEEKEKILKGIVKLANKEVVKETDRTGLTLQHFMSDMIMLGEQTRNPNLMKPSSFNFGDGTVTNYLLWLVLAELMILNGAKV